MADRYVFGTGFFGTLFIALLVLKLCHVISWSWWWIFAPLWGSFLIGIIILLVVLLIYLIGEKRKRW
jgi:hypothetical protein